MLSAGDALGAGCAELRGRLERGPGRTFPIFVTRDASGAGLPASRLGSPRAAPPHRHQRTRQPRHPARPGTRRCSPQRRRTSEAAAPTGSRGRAGRSGGPRSSHLGGQSRDGGSSGALQLPDPCGPGGRFLRQPRGEPHAADLGPSGFLPVSRSAGRALAGPLHPYPPRPAPGSAWPRRTHAEVGLALPRAGWFPPAPFPPPHPIPAPADTRPDPGVRACPPRRGRHSGALGSEPSLGWSCALRAGPAP